MKKIILAAFVILATLGSTVPAAQESGSSYIVYYLYKNFRCYSCNKIEEVTEKSIKGGKVELDTATAYNASGEKFALNVKNGNLKFMAVNVDTPENQHLLHDFQTRAKFPVMVELKDGKVVRYRVLDQAWTYLKKKDAEAFVNYIQSSLLDFMNGK